jgi:intracellular septation protein
MKWLFDLFPVILFFAAYKLAGLYTATAVAIAATFVQIGWLRLRGRTIEPALWLSLGVIVVFGGATLLLHDEVFIKWKPTVLYLMFTVGLVVAQVFFGRNPMRAVMGKQITLPDTVWRRLNYAWAAFFALLAVFPGLALSIGVYGLFLSPETAALEAEQQPASAFVPDAAQTSDAETTEHRARPTVVSTPNRTITGRSGVLDPDDF